MVHGNRFGNPYGTSRRPRVGFPIWEEVAGFGGGGVVVFVRALTKRVRARGDSRPTASGSVRGSGVWVGARKLEGELDVGGRRILCPTGESIVVTAEPAGFWTGARVEV